MRKIDLDHYPRWALLAAFKDREVPVFSVTCPVDITAFKRFADGQGLGFFVSLSFLLAQAVNRVAELRHRLIDGELYEFERVDPGYTVLQEDGTFSFCDARYFEDFKAYKAYAQAKIEEARRHPDCRTIDKHHMFFISNLPWFSFTAITHPYSQQYASIPVIAVGKYFEDNGRILLPVGIQVHHGLVDGIHVGAFYRHLTELCGKPEDALR